MPFNYLVTTYVLYGLKRHFFEDNFSTMLIMTYFFAVISTAIQWILLLTLDRQIIDIDLEFILTDFVIMPLGDTFIAFILYSIPSLLMNKPQLKGSDYFST